MYGLMRRTAWALVLSTWALLAGGPVTSAFAQAPAAQISMQESNAEHILVELIVDKYDIQTAQEHGQTYQRIHIPDTVDSQAPGAPQLPATGVLLGVPRTEGVSVEIVDADYESVADVWIAPAPRLSLALDGSGDHPAAVQETFDLDSTLYAQDALYPASPVEIGSVGFVRDQAVAQLLFHPVQFNPAQRKARIYRRILARVTWASTIASAGTTVRTESRAYESVLASSLLNYPALQRPPVATSATAGASVYAAAADNGDVIVKLGVSADGIHRVRRNDLVQNGFDLTTLDPRRLQISVQGAEVPIYVVGEEDGVFDNNDYVLFYGKANTELYTKENVYWLTEGTAPGQRMAVRNGAPAGANPVPTSFVTTIHQENDTWYWDRMPDGEGEDHWFWDDRISPATQNLDVSRGYDFGLNHIAANGQSVQVRVRLKGYTNSTHRTRLLLNGTEIDEQEWSGQIIFDHEVSVSQSLLLDGANVLEVEATDSGAEVDQVLINWFEIDYWDTYVAEDNELQFGVAPAGTYRFEVAGFTEPDVMVFDITQPSAPALITATELITVANEFQVNFNATTQAQTSILALSSSQFQRPTFTVDETSNWRSLDNGADYIIITYDDFYTNTLPLADHRRAGGLRVAVVKVGDIYDEFSFGVLTPQAIRDFLSYAYENWEAPAPTYVLLVGDARQDYPRIKQNWVPTQIVESDLAGQVASDNWFVSVSGDDILPDMMIGRLSAENAEQVDAMVDNIIAYDGLGTDQSWQKTALFIADDDETIFESISNELADRLPFYYQVEKVYASQYSDLNPPVDISADVKARIDGGTVLVNYTGHGAEHIWGKWHRPNEVKDQYDDNIYDWEDVPLLENAGRLPVVTVANCLSGVFALGFRSMAEAFQRGGPNGAVAVWAPTSLGYPSGHRILMDEFYRSIFWDDQIGLGAATTAAKLETFARGSFWAELVETYVLFGDPASELAIPATYPYVAGLVPENEAEDVATDQALQITFNRPVNTTTFQLTGQDVAGLDLNPTWNPDNTEVSLAHSPLARGKRYEFTVDGEDWSGSPIQAGPVPLTWSFTVATDNVPPTVTLSVQLPVPAQDGQPAQPLRVLLAFSEAMRTGDIAYEIDPALGGFLTWDTGTRVATFTAQQELEPNRAYTFTVTAAADLAGNALEEPESIPFTLEEEISTYLPNVLRQ